MLVKELIKKYWWLVGILLLAVVAYVSVMGALFVDELAPAEAPAAVFEGTNYAEAPYLFPDEMMKSDIMPTLFAFSAEVFGEDFLESEDYNVVAYIQYGDQILLEVRGVNAISGEGEIWVLEFKYVYGIWTTANAVMNATQAEYEPHYELFLRDMEDAGREEAAE